MTGHMRYQRLLLEHGSLSFTLSLHPRLTVISGVGAQEREGLVGELLGAMTGTRRGIRLELADDRGRELVVERGDRPQDDRVLDRATGADVTHEFRTATGGTVVDVLAGIGLAGDTARRHCRMTSADVRAAGQGDVLIARLARLDQNELWKAADRVVRSDATLRSEAEAVGASADDAPLIEMVEERHAAFEAAQARHESVRHHGIFVGGAAALGAVPAALLNKWTALPFLLVALATTVVSIAYRRRMQQARAAEQEALEAAGAESYKTFQLQRMTQLMDSEQTRQRLADAAAEHRQAAAAWRALAGDVAPDWALSVRDRVLVAANRPEPLDPDAFMPEPAQLAESMIVRLAELRHAGAAGESVPLILDEPLVGMVTSVKQWMLELLGRSAGAPQVVYMTNDDDVAAWARIEALAGALELIEPATVDAAY